MSTVLEKPFQKMGARVKVREADRRFMSPGVTAQPTVALDVRRDEKGEYFDVQVTGNPALTVMDVQPSDRHLVLLARMKTGEGRFDKSKFLCGHDERHWFVAAIPETAPVTTVEQAKEALKPTPVLERQRRLRLPAHEKHTRHNVAFKRQGEWFFLPVDITPPNPAMIRKREPFNRGRGKFHYAEEAFRLGGRTVYVAGRNNNKILSPEEFNKLTEDERKKLGSARIMQEGATLYVRGRITHSDHSTIRLDGWHEVAMNEEHRSRAMGFVRFLD